MANRRSTARDLAQIAIFAALIAALGLPGTITVGSTGVPITLQSLGIMLTGGILGARKGFLAVAVFLLTKGVLSGPSLYSTIGMRHPNEQSGSTSLFAHPTAIEPVVLAPEAGEAATPATPRTSTRTIWPPAPPSVWTPPAGWSPPASKRG